VATVYIPALLQNLTGGKASLTASGSTVRQLIEDLETACPGIRERLMQDERLRPNISVAIDGEIGPMGLLERVRPESEVHFVTAIQGGL
jgi:hypothetical protein